MHIAPESTHHHAPWPRLPWPLPRIGRLTCFLFALTASGCGDENTQISFKESVLPILEEHCAACHIEGTEGYLKSGLLLNNYRNLMKGTTWGPIVVPGESSDSVFVQAVDGEVGGLIRMPPDKPLAKEDVETLRTWVDQGAKNN